MARRRKTRRRLPHDAQLLNQQNNSNVAEDESSALPVARRPRQASKVKTLTKFLNNSYRRTVEENNSLHTHRSRRRRCQTKVFQLPLDEPKRKKSKNPQMTGTGEDSRDNILTETTTKFAENQSNESDSNYLEVKSYEDSHASMGVKRKKPRFIKIIREPCIYKGKTKGQCPYPCCNKPSVHVNRIKPWMLSTSKIRYVQWKKVEELRLIELFRNEPSLYDTESPSYHNQSEKARALTKITQAMLPLKPELILPDVNVKLSFLKWKFNKNLTKLRNSSSSLYGPTRWWLFEKLKFLEPTLYTIPRPEPSLALEQTPVKVEIKQEPEEYEDIYSQIEVNIKEEPKDSNEFHNETTGMFIKNQEIEEDDATN